MTTTTTTCPRTCPNCGDARFDPAKAWEFCCGCGSVVGDRPAPPRIDWPRALGTDVRGALKALRREVGR